MDTNDDVDHPTLEAVRGAIQQILQGENLLDFMNRDNVAEIFVARARALLGDSPDLALAVELLVRDVRETMASRAAEPTTGEAWRVAETEHEDGP